MAGKQAKYLTEAQQRAVLGYLESTRHAVRNKALFLLSVKAGLRAKEIAALIWTNVTDAEGELSNTIELTDQASKGKSGRVIPLNHHLKAALAGLLAETQPQPSDHVIQMERDRAPSAQVIVNWFWRLYRQLGFDQASSHSGRRTFITNAARKISTVGGSLRDVQGLAGHSSLQTTQRYIEADAEARRKVVDLI